MYDDIDRLLEHARFNVTDHDSRQRVNAALQQAQADWVNTTHGHATT